MHLKIYICFVLCLIFNGCISATDVSKEKPFQNLVGKQFKTKVTCKLKKIEGSDYLVAKHIAKRNNKGQLVYQKGSIQGAKNQDFIEDGTVFTVSKIIRQKSFDNDFLQIIGTLNFDGEKIDFGFLFQTWIGGEIKIDDKFLEAVK